MSGLFIKKIFIFLLLAKCTITFGQNSNAIIDLGINMQQKGNHFEAHQLFQKAINLDSTSARIHFYYGLNMIHLHRYNKASWHLEKVLKKDASGKKFPEASYFLGEMKKHQRKYNEAILLFKKTKAHYVHDQQSYYYKKANREINSSIYAMRHKEHLDQHVQILAMNETINGNNADFSGFENNGKFYFTSVKDHQHAQIYLQKNLKEIIPIDTLINDTHYHNANGVFINKQQNFLFSRCDSIGHCKIMISKKNNEKWQEPIEFNHEINNSAHNITQPTFAEFNGGKYLFFSTDKKGGLGKMDIWYTEIMDDLSITKIINAGPNINSPDNDITPFYHQPSNRLYFSSTWHNGFGGYDIFYSHWNDSIFEKPQNANQPINSPWNDLYFWINEKGDHGYVSSNRDGSHYDSIPHCCPDIWSFDSDETIAKKEIIDNNLTSNEIFKHVTGLTLPLALYFHNDEPSPKSLDTTVSISYPETYHKYMDLKSLYIKEFTNRNTLNERKIADEQIKYFFDNYITGGLNRLEKFKTQLSDLLNEYESIEITIKGFASPLAKSDYNSNLSKRRISSLVNYFHNVDNGKFKPYINNGQLIIKSAPFGENKSSNSASDDYNNTQQSIYSPKAAIERRIEIQEVIFNYK